MRIASVTLSFLILVGFSGCGPGAADSTPPTPITLPLKMIESEGTITPRPLPDNLRKSLEIVLEDVLSKTQAKGISAAVAKPDAGLWSGSRGLSGKTPAGKINPGMKFYAGSIGKVFTAVVVLNLVEEGLLSLESPIAQWLPEISRATDITIKQLLSHTSGIPSYDNCEEFKADDPRYLNPWEIILLIQSKGLLFEPGRHYSYSNTGYLGLGLIIEQVAGITYKDAVEKYIIEKLDLNQTEVLTPQALEMPDVAGHHKGDAITNSIYYAIPFSAGNIVATPTDLVLFLQALMSGRLLSDDSLQKMFTDMNLISTTQSDYYGLGIVAAINTPVGDIIGHTGGAKGFGAALYYHPKDNLFTCAMMNDDTKPVEPAMFRLMEAMMAGEDI